MTTSRQREGLQLIFVLNNVCAWQTREKQKSICIHMAVIEVQIQRIVPELFYLSCVFNRNTVTGIRSSLHSIECQLAH